MEKLSFFSYLWMENVSQLFIRKQIEIAQQSFLTGHHFTAKLYIVME